MPDLRTTPRTARRLTSPPALRLGCGFVIGFSEWATEILQRTWQAARRLNPDAMIRLHRTADGVAFDLTDERAETDALVHGDGFELLVEEGLGGTVDVVEPHDRLVLRPPGDTERSVKPHEPGAGTLTTPRVAPDRER
jgi:hypothetical protein